MVDSGAQWGDYDSHRILVRIHGEPLGFIAAQGIASPEMFRRSEICQSLDGQSNLRLIRHLDKDGIDVASFVQGKSDIPAKCLDDLSRSVGEFSVVICTRDRAESLQRVLVSCRDLGPRLRQLVVVDNAPKNDATRALVEELAGLPYEVTYVLEPRPGLSRARNSGFAVAKSEFVAFTDDDVVIDPLWLDGLALGFSRDATVGCVTGLVPAAALDTREQGMFEAKVRWGKSCAQANYGPTPPVGEPLYPFNSGIFGTGANFAIRNRLGSLLGPFDVALGAGTLCRGGEDLDYFLRVILAGLRIVYEPTALLWHYHRDDAVELRRQLRGYGSGTTAYVAKHLLAAKSGWPMLRRLPRAVQVAPAITKGSSTVPIPRELRWAEVFGLLEGPTLYMRQRRRDARTARLG
jgi:glycosyltransferase involved in cell wall biosynthesis